MECGKKESGWGHGRKVSYTNIRWKIEKIQRSESESEKQLKSQILMKVKKIKIYNWIKMLFKLKKTSPEIFYFEHFQF